jgi:hypothetical protein
MVVVTESALDFVKAAAARSSSNTTAEALNYLVVDVHFQEFEKPKPLKMGEVPKPSMFASELQFRAAVAQQRPPIHRAVQRCLCGAGKTAFEF